MSELKVSNLRRHLTWFWRDDCRPTSVVVHAFVTLLVTAYLLLFVLLYSWYICIRTVQQTFRWRVTVVWRFESAPNTITSNTLMADTALYNNNASSVLMCYSSSTHIICAMCVLESSGMFGASRLTEYMKVILVRRRNIDSNMYDILLVR